MRHVICCLALILISCFQINGQGIVSRTGPVVESDVMPRKLLLEKDGRIYTLSGNKQKVFLESYSSEDLTFVDNKEIVLPEIDDKEQIMEDIYPSTNGFVVFTSLWDKKTDSFVSKGYLLDTEGNMVGEDLNLFEAEVDKKGESLRVDYWASADHKYFVGVMISAKRKLEIKKFTFKFFDSSLREVYSTSKEFSMETNLKDIAFDREGAITLLLTERRVDKKEGIAIVSSNLMTLNRQGDMRPSVNIDASDRQLFTTDIDYLSNGQVLLTGMYAETKDNPWSNCAGHAFILFDTESNSVITSKFEKFDLKFRESMIMPKRLAKADPFVTLSNYFLPRERIIHPDGSITSISEEHFVSSNQHARGVTTTYYYGKIFVVHYNKDGDIIWSQIIPKSQYSTQNSPALGIGFGSLMFSANFFEVGRDDSDFFSYGLFENNDELSFVFYDNAENTDIKPIYSTENLKNVKSGIPVLLTLDKDGNMRKSKFTVSGDADLHVAFRYSLEMGKKDELFVSMKGKSRQWCILGLE